MDLDLTDKVAVVSGGSRGMGKAIARQLAIEGADVVVVARGAEALEATAKELATTTGRRIVPITADTREDASVKAMADAAGSAFGHLDILVNCAASPGGQGPAPRFDEITNEAFFEDMNTKVLGYLRCAREVAPYMKRQGWGRIISLSGMAARQGGAALGSMRNVAVVAMTKNLADELGPYGINVTVVHPGRTRTEATESVLARRMAAEGISHEEAERQLLQGNVLRRAIDATDVANVVTFLASPRSVAITGDVIAAGGGSPVSIYY
ncbi:MAG TPA: SDR family oxidoreductase [Chloroflexota bacterium]